MNRIHIAVPALGLAFLLLACLNSELRAYGSSGCTCAHCLAGNTHSQDFEGYYIGGDHELAAFQTFGNGWTSTASGRSTIGAPATVTWSVVADGTQLPTGLGEPASNNSLVAFLDGIHHGGASPGGSDLTQRDWWQLMNSAFERWDELSGISYIYEPNDDGARLAANNGILGVRGDHRIGGHPIDGQTSPTFLAYNFFPNNSDMVIDTDEINRWSNATNNYRLFRNMLMHEIGHGFGLNHVESFDVNPNQEDHQFGTFLMEPILASRFDGPQFDDILGAHRLYGDVNEEGTGNNSSLTATELGNILPGGTVSIGTDAADISVGEDDTDFVSIDDNGDIDYFKFSVSTPELINVLLSPLGPTYDEGPQGSGNAGTQRSFNAAAQSDLSITLYDTNGTTLLVHANNTGLGESEAIHQYELAAAGDYFLRIGGTGNAAQFFQLDVMVVPEPGAMVLFAFGCVGIGVSRTRRARTSRR